MSERINYFWRLFATGFSFFMFGAAGFFVWVVLFPLVQIFLGQGTPKKRRSRYLMHWVLRWYIGLMHHLGLLTYEIHGRERLNQPGRLVVANHPSLIDILFLISLIRNATCIVKPALMHNPFMSIPIKAMQYQYANDPKTLLDRCVAEVLTGSSLVVFPEGTRTTPGEAMKFQRGAANIALESGAKILPVYIHCAPTTLTKREKWYEIPPRRVHFSLFVGEDIDPAPFANRYRAMAARNLTRHLHSYFVEQAIERGHA